MTLNSGWKAGIFPLMTLILARITLIFRQMTGISRQKTQMLSEMREIL